MLLFEIMPDRCVVYGCSNTKDKNLGISVHKIPFFGDERLEAKKRRRKWTDFVKRKRAKWTDTKFSVVCSEHFLPTDFDRPFASVPGMEFSYRRGLVTDEIGIAVSPSVQEPKKRSNAVISARSRRQVTEFIFKSIVINGNDILKTLSRPEVDCSCLFQLLKNAASTATDVLTSSADPMDNEPADMPLEMDAPVMVSAFSNYSIMGSSAGWKVGGARENITMTTKGFLKKL